MKLLFISLLFSFVVFTSCNQSFLFGEDIDINSKGNPLDTHPSWKKAKYKKNKYRNWCW